MKLKGKEIAYKEATVNDILDWCEQNGELEWLLEYVTTKTPRTRYKKIASVDEFGKEIQNAERDIHFYDLDSYCIYDTSKGEYIYDVVHSVSGGNDVYKKRGESKSITITSDMIIMKSPSDYIIECGVNKFKVNSVPDNINTMYCIQGYVSKENHSDINDENNRTYFCYTFYIRNELQGIIATRQNATDGTIPMTGGIDDVTIVSGASEDLYVYTFAFFDNETSPANITYEISDEDLISISRVGNKFTITSKSQDKQGEGMVIFTASDGEKSVSISVSVHIVT
jgi:hypothetical protein